MKSKSQKFRIESSQWLLTVKSFKGKPYYFRFSNKKEAMDFSQNGNFGSRELRLYKTTNKLIKVWK